MEKTKPTTAEQGRPSEKIEPHLHQLEQLAASLTIENLAELDLDSLCTTLESHRQLLAETARAADQLAVLRRDYIGRIAAMIRAIAATLGRKRTRSSTHPPEAALDLLSGPLLPNDLLDSLESATAEELIVHHRRIFALFRSTFPSTFDIDIAKLNQP